MLTTALTAVSYGLLAAGPVCAAAPALSVSSPATAAVFAQGKIGVLTFSVVNAGGDTDPADTVSVRVTAPTGLTLLGAAEHGAPLVAATWQCAPPAGGGVTCTNLQPIAGRTAPAIDATFAVGAATVSGSVPVALASSDVGDADVASTAVAFTVAPPYTLVFASPAVAGPTTALATLGPIVLEVKDATGNVRTVDDATTVGLGSTSPGGGFAAYAGGPAVSEVTIPAHASGTSLYYADTLPGVPRLIASAPGLAAAGQVETIALGPAAQLAFLGRPPAGATSGAATLGPLTIQLRDAYGNPVTAAAATVVRLTTTSTHGWFAAQRASARVASVSIAAGSSTATLWYGDTAGGTPRLRATADGLTAAEQVATLTSSSTGAADRAPRMARVALTVSPHSPLRYRARTRHVTLTARVTGAAGAPTGTVTFTSGRHALCIHRALRGATVSCRVRVVTSIGAGGSHALSAVYSGDETYRGRAASARLRVVKLPRR